MRMQTKRADDTIPTSSMADIAFLLIVYFMVTTTFAATRGLDFSLPKDDDTPPVIEKEDSVLIEVLPNGQLMVDQNPKEPDEIFEYLKPKLESYPKKPVIIKPHTEAPYGFMLEVFDVLRKIKIKQEGTAVRVYTVTMQDIQDAEKLEEELGEDVNVSIPTQREIETFWF